jgi:methionyl-tRNA formyltransferase
MAQKDFRIVFMGTPDFAVESLRKLIDSGKKVVAVVTAPDKPAGRGRKLAESPVKQFAIEAGLEVLQPVNLKDPEFIQGIRDFQPSLVVVVAFRMLPKLIWEIPEFGTINLHASLLPHYRGAAPINWAIIHGESKTGVTTFLIEEQIDTGDILLQEEVAISESDHAGSLHDKLMRTGAELLDTTVNGLMNMSIQAVSQKALAPHDPKRNAPKLTRENTRIDWGTPVIDIHNFVRGLAPYPGAWTELVKDDIRLSPVKIFETTPEITSVNRVFGSVLTDEKTFLKVAVKGGYIHITRLQLPGKNSLAVTEFLKGFKSIADYRLE